jgi:hypothetical protein
MTFNISSQSAGVINNVGGDQWNQVTIGDDDARVQVRALRRALERAGLPPAVAREAAAHLDGAEAEMARPVPAKPAVAERLRELTRILASAGSLAAAGGALLGPIGAVAGWLGGLGKPILDMIDHHA